MGVEGHGKMDHGVDGRDRGQAKLKFGRSRRMPKILVAAVPILMSWGFARGSGIDGDIRLRGSTSAFSAPPCMKRTNFLTSCLMGAAKKRQSWGYDEAMRDLCRPIGRIRTCFPRKNGTPRQGNVCPSSRAQLEIKFGTRPEHSLEGLDEFSHVWLLFLFDRNTPGSTPKAKVYPPRLGGTPTGLFATRSPHRPNPIGLTLCRLDRVDGSKLSLSGVDLVDGTCILDVKPFIPSYDAPIGEIDLPSWAAMREKDGLGVSFSDKAEKELDKIIAAGIMPSVMNSWDEVKAALVQVLAADPRSTYRKDKMAGQQYPFYFDCLDVHCSFDDKSVTVDSIFYTPSEAERKVSGNSMQADGGSSVSVIQVGSAHQEAAAIAQRPAGGETEDSDDEDEVEEASRGAGQLEAVGPTTEMLRIIGTDEIPSDCAEPVDAKALEQARAIVDSIRAGGEAALVAVSSKYGDIEAGESYTYGKHELKEAFLSLPLDQQALLERVSKRILKFAAAQRASISDMETDIPGGRAGHTVSACDSAGCYAPGGRYPLPSSVLMTACTARAAGVKTVWVASPHPDKVTMAAAHVAGVDGMLKVGGAQAVATMSQGIGPVPKCDIIVGPGNQWVTAAKSLVSQSGTAIDMLAGPSEVLVICDETADPATVASDLLAQAEHDVEARPIMVSTNRPLVDHVNSQIKKQLQELPSPNKETATQAVSKGFAVVASSFEEAIKISDKIAPEHLEIMTKDAMEVGMKCAHYGGLFIGGCAAEVLGDYGCGPNHVLPTAGTARYTGGLSVHTFLRTRTWMRIDEQQDVQGVVDDSIALARLEGLEAHARAAEKRLL